jgi:hypothetical protein
MSLQKCDICLETKLTIIGCESCKFCVHESCLIKWFSSCGNCLCPHCKKEKSYKIDYSKVVYAPKEDDDINSIIQMIGQLDIETIMDVLHATIGTSIFNVPRRNNDNTLHQLINEYIQRENSDNDNSISEQVSQNEMGEIINPVFSQLPLDIVVSEILKEGQMFAPDTFIRNFNTLPIQIRAKWTYKPVKMQIDGREEIIAYVISKTDDDPNTEDEEDIYEDDLID